MMRPPHRKSPAAAQKPGSLRIIGGSWRGRRLAFPSLEGLRPTPDRVRETLFNWLATPIVDARCLDLFSGSGALALEALSRGAQHATLIEQQPVAVAQLRTHLQTLRCEGAQVIHADALQWLQNAAAEPFDVVFIDPPFHRDLAQRSLDALAQSTLLAESAWIYLEMGSDEPLPGLPPHWTVYRQQIAGNVCYRLLRAQAAAAT